MSKIMSKAFIAIVSVLLVTSAVAAQDFKIGVVNSDRVLRESTAAKQAETRLQQEFGRREKELVEREGTLKTNAERFERDAPTLSETQRANRQKQLVELDREFQRKRREFQEDLNARRGEEHQQLLEKATKVIQQLAEQEKYDVVLQEAVYINPKHDMTERVIRSLNAK
jgi:outer membrane protein